MLAARPDALSLRRSEGRKKRLAVLGCTGSIGRSTLSIIREHSEQFEVVALSAGKNVRALAANVREFKPRYIHIADPTVRSALDTQVRGGYSGMQLDERGMDSLLRSGELDLVVAGVVGFEGLPSVVAALEGGATVALANKESLVSAGSLLAEIITRKSAALIPVDSEHSALFQALQGESLADIDKLILTASGGPFFGLSREQIRSVTPEQALRHPTWSMGNKITIDSASMVNKALELAEAHWLFAVSAADIEIVVHPQSIVHSLIRWCDGSAIAQLGVPDMRVPIAYALQYPFGRLSRIAPPLDLTALETLNFFPLDTDTFRAPEIMRRCLEQGGVAAAVFTIANDLAVERFLAKTIRFDQIISTIERALERYAHGGYSDLSDLLSIRDRMYAERGSFIAG